MGSTAQRKEALSPHEHSQAGAQDSLDKAREEAEE